MIFAFDLDRTMIFSEKALDELSGGNKVSCVPIEVRTDGLKSKVVSYIPKKAYDILYSMDVLENVFLIPVTTRSLEQFKRVNYFNELEYAVCANGGVILHRGKKLRLWEERTQVFMSKAMDTYEKVMNNKDILDFCTSKPKIVDDTYVYFKTKEREKVAKFLDTFLEGTSCVYTIQGEKVYVMHKEISKEGAIKYISELIGNDYLVTFGDGKLDKNLVFSGDIGLVPLGSELYMSLSFPEINNLRVLGKGPHATIDAVTLIQNIIDHNLAYCILKS